ncbi:hypothetical protein P9112_002808 [Eukaryota sp. TZLM1-RC]
MSKLNSLQTKVIQLKHTITTYQNYCKSHNLPLPQVSDVFFAPDTLQKVSNAFSLRSDLNDLRHDINTELTSIESQLQSSLSLALSDASVKKQCENEDYPIQDSFFLFFFYDQTICNIGLIIQHVNVVNRICLLIF